MTLVTFEYPCGEWKDGLFNINGSTIVNATLIQITGDTAIVQFDSASHETGLLPGETLTIPADQLMASDQEEKEFDQLVDAIVFQMFDQCECPKCGPRSKSQGQVINGSCSACGSIVEECEEEIEF
jgi:hypothetical protein